MYRDITSRTSTPIHTGEQIYLRENFKQLIEMHAVDVLGPDPLDCGGLAELKWICECGCGTTAWSGRSRVDSTNGSRASR